MKPGAFFINTAQGELVVEQDLIEAIPRLGPVALDTWCHEPDINRQLLDLVDIATPHIAGYSADGKAAGTAAAVQTVAARLGLPLTDWRPSGIPAPAQPLSFALDAAGKPLQEVLSEQRQSTSRM